MLGYVLVPLAKYGPVEFLSSENFILNYISV